MTGETASGRGSPDPASFRNRVAAFGFDKNDVLFSSSGVGCVQWRDENGEILALLVSLKPNVWGFSKRGDDDWQQVLGQYGNPDA